MMPHLKRLLPIAALVPALLATLIADASVDAPPWSANQRLFGDLGVSVQSEPAIAVGGNNVLVAWADERNSQPDIYADIYSAGLVTQSNQRLTDQNGGSPTSDTSPAAIIQADGRAFVAYSDQDDVWLMRRNPGASTWLSRTQVTPANDPYYADGRKPAIAADGDNIVVVWQDYRNGYTYQDNNGDTVDAHHWDIYAARCNGATLVCQSGVRVNDGNTRAQIKPKVAINGANVTVVWEDARNGANKPAIYASMSADGGATWGAAARVDAVTGAGAGPATTPAVAYEGASVWAVWEQHPGTLGMPADIYAAKWSGTIWQYQLRLDQAPAGKRAVNPVAASSSAGIFFAWEDYRNGNSNPDIFTAHFTTNWVEDPAGVGPGMQTRPALGMDGNEIHIAWQDARNGQPDVYTARWNGTAWVDIAKANDDAQRMSAQNFPSLAVALNGDMAAVWFDNRNYEPEIMLSRYTASTQTWSAATPVPSRGGDRYGLAEDTVGVAFDLSNQVHVVWSQDSKTGRQIFYSMHNGYGWSGVQQLSDNTSAPNGVWRPRYHVTLAGNKGKIAATWVSADYSPGWPPATSVYAAWLTNGVWTPQSAVVPGAPQGDVFPSVAIDDSGNTYVAWNVVSKLNGIRSDIKVAKMTAAGGAWSAPVQINSQTSNIDWCYHEMPKLAVTGNTVHAAWLGCVSSNRGIYYSSSADGVTWKSPSVKVGDVTDSYLSPALGVRSAGGTELAIVYPNKTNNAMQFYAARAVTTTWSGVAQVSDGATNGRQYEDGFSSVVYNPALNKFVALFVDNRTRDVSQLYTANMPSAYAAPALPTPMATATGGPGPVGTATPVVQATVDPRLNKRVYLPTVRR